MSLTVPVTASLRVVDLRPGDVLLGEQDGSCVVYDVGGESLLAGFWTVRTEHGTLLLDMAESVPALRP
jgi:hypothetical protein